MKAFDPSRSKFGVRFKLEIRARDKRIRELERKVERLEKRQKRQKGETYGISKIHRTQNSDSP